MRSKLWHTLTMAAALVLFSSSATYAFSATVKGHITDSEGAAIKGAEVLFHLDPSGNAKPSPSVDVFRKTNATGGFEIQLTPGFYDVCIMATAFTPECSKILVNKENQTDHDVHLNASPLVIKHLGDRF